LFSLTGWIPERLFLPERLHELRDFETHPERAWERVSSSNSYGDCLITVSTSRNISKEEADHVGLVTGHAYAVLNVFKTSTGVRLLQCKNPWANKSWRGSYSIMDPAWTPQLCSEIGYNPVEAAKIDDGVFFISWDDIIKYFRNIYLSWNPMLFSCVSITHSRWLSSNLAPKDDYNVGDNPQYIISLSDNAIKEKASIWILISRHITKQEQEGEESTEFISLNIHRNSNDLPRIWYPGGKSCVVRGVYTNNPHILMRYDVNCPKDKFLSLVLAQHNKTSNINYTLTCYCTHDFKFGTSKKLPIKLDFCAEWTKETCGGAPGRGHFFSNPQFLVNVPPGGAYVQFSCTTDANIFCNIALVKSDGSRVNSVGNSDLHAGKYRPAFAITDVCSVGAGNYTLIASTFDPCEIGRFLVTAYSSVPLVVKSIPEEGLNMHKTIFYGAWSKELGTAAGCSNFGRYHKNPAYYIQTDYQNKFDCVRLVARIYFYTNEHDRGYSSAVNLAMYELPDNDPIKIPRHASPVGPYPNIASSNKGIYESDTTKLEVGLRNGVRFILVPSLFDPVEMEYVLTIYSFPPCNIQQLR